MNTLDAILAPTVAQCVCPECGTRWLGEIASGLATELGQPDGTVRVWCDVCQAKPRQASLSPPQARQDDPWAVLCPEEYRLTSEGGLTDRERLKKAWGHKPDLTRLNAKQIVELVHSRQPVLLVGAPGTLKTRLAWRMVRMVWDRSQAVRCFTSWQFQAELQDAGADYQSAQWMRDLLLAELVFIDDLGKAEWTANTHGAFFELLEGRISRRKPILITTNETYESLRGARAEHKSAVAKSAANPVIRRFRDFATTVVMQRV